MVLPGAFALFFLVVLALVVVPFVFWIVAIIDVARAPEPAFGPPWDNGKNSWLLGLVISMVVPAGTVVTTVLWWVQGRAALRAGAPVPKPFWAGGPRQPPPYPPYPPVHPPAGPPDLRA